MRVKRAARKAACFLSHYSGLGHLWYRFYARHAVRVLCYHEVEPVPASSYSVSVANFDKQMELLRNQCNVISLDDYRALRLAGNPISPDTVVLTFDDGYRSFQKTVLPILRKHGLPATCFVITSQAGAEESRFLHWSELREIAQDGLVTIGSHSSSHARLSALKEELLEQEIVGSKIELERRLGQEVRLFSYPYGTFRDIDERCTRFASTAGYALACTSIQGVNSRTADPLRLRRTKIEWGDDISTFQKIIRGRLDCWILVDYLFGFLQNKGEVDFATH